MSLAFHQPCGPSHVLYGEPWAAGVPHQCWVEEKEHLPQPAGSTSPISAVDVSSQYSQEYTLEAYLVVTRGALVHLTEQFKDMK